MFEFLKKFSQKKGYITLITILIIATIGLSISVSLLIFGLNSSRSSFINEQSGQAKYLADTCAEEALQKIRDDISFKGSGSLSLGQGTCSYNVIVLNGENREIYSSSTLGTIIRKVKVVIETINPQIKISSWQELSEL